MVLRIINEEEHKIFMIGLKVTTILTMFYVHDLLGFLDLETVYCATVCGGVSRGRSVKGGMSHGTRDM